MGAQQYLPAGFTAQARNHSGDMADYGSVKRQLWFFEQQWRVAIQKDPEEAE
jgi:hypothetical protein